MTTRTPITNKEWEDAIPTEQGLKDKHGRIWEILENLGKQSMGHALRVRCPGYPPEVLVMSNMYQDYHIIDTESDENGILIEFEEEGAAIVSL